MENIEYPIDWYVLCCSCPWSRLHSLFYLCDVCYDHKVHAHVTAAVLTNMQLEKK